MDLFAQVWPEASETGVPQRRKSKRMCGSHILKGRQVPFVICAQAKVQIGTTLSPAVRAVQAFE